MRSALSIAGSDPSGGGGLQLDLQVFRHLGVHGSGAVTALTIQDTRRVHRVLPVFPSAVLDQIRVVLRDCPPGAIKIGMLASDDVARAVTHALEELPVPPAGPPRVVDPVLRASDGTPLLETRAIPTLTGLIARSDLVTPNLPEAEALTGIDVGSRAGCEAAARALLELGARAVLLKGGHREGPPDDLLLARERAGEVPVASWLAGERSEGPPVRGTGCALSAAIAAGLARGHGLWKAVEDARRFVASALARARTSGPDCRVLVFP